MEGLDVDRVVSLVENVHKICDGIKEKIFIRFDIASVNYKFKGTAKISFTMKIYIKSGKDQSRFGTSLELFPPECVRAFYV